MKVHHSVAAYTNKQPAVVTIGTFDGVHLGHKVLLEKVLKTAKQEGLESVVLTFFPHPRMVLQTDSDIKLINTISEKEVLLDQTGLDHLIIHPFTREFSRLTALEYVRDILVNGLNAKKIIIGYDHRFGRNRTATIEDLHEFGTTYDFEVEEIGVHQLNEIAISSTKIRNALAAGDITTANEYLGYYYMLNGTVIRGKGIGGPKLNFPTANLHISEDYKQIPKIGVYIVQTFIAHKKYFGITNIGTNPTVGGTQKTIETYFLDFDGDLYNCQLELQFVQYIREEESFDSLEQLKLAIAKDEAYARSYINENE